MASFLEYLPLNSEGGTAADPSFEGTLVENEGGMISFIGLSSDLGDKNICLDFKNSSVTKKLNPDFYWVPESLGKRVLLRVEAKMETVELNFLIPATNPNEQP